MDAPPGSAPSRRAWWPAVAAAALTVLVMADALSPERTFWYRDLGTQFHPVIAEARATEAGGVDMLPFWTHASSSGRPLVANPGFSFLSPLAVLWLVLPHESAFDLFLVLHAALAAAGMALLARGLGGSPQAALLAGAALGLGGGVVSGHNLLWTLVALAWAPWVLLAGLRACESPSPRRLGLLALALALQADGGMPEVVLGTLVLGGVVSLTAWPARGDGHPGALRRAVRVALVWGFCGVWGIALAAPQLVPAALHARTTLRAVGFTASGLLYNSLDPQAIPGLLVPGWGGNPMNRWLPGGFPGSAWTESGTPYVLSHYCGLVVVLLAAAGLRLALRRDAPAPGRRGLAVGLAAVAACGVVIALGRHVGLVRWAAEAVAPVPLRFTVKALFMTFLALPPLAALGLDGLMARAEARLGIRGSRLLGAAVALLAALDLAATHRGMMPTMPSSLLREPPLVGVLEARARELGVDDGAWCLHHQRFPDGEWVPPEGGLAPGDLTMHVWQKRMLMSPTAMPHGIRYAFDRLGDLLEDVRTFEAARDIYRLPRAEWARELGAAGVLFVISPLDDLEAASGGELVRDRQLGPDVGVPPGSGTVYRVKGFRPRYELEPEGALAWAEDHGGMTVRVRSPVPARLHVREAFGDPATWRVTTEHGGRMPLEPDGRCFGAVTVPAGETVVRFDHEPRGWKPSLLLALAAWIGLAIALLKCKGVRRVSA